MTKDMTVLEDLARYAAHTLVDQAEAVDPKRGPGN